MLVKKKTETKQNNHQKKQPCQEIPIPSYSNIINSLIQTHSYKDSSLLSMLLYLYKLAPCNFYLQISTTLHCVMIIIESMDLIIRDFHLTE